MTEQYFVVRGNVQQIAKILFCFFRHLNKRFTPVADFHHRRTQTVPVTQLLLSLLSTSAGNIAGPELKLKT
jgi:hypothetical protein